MQINVTRDLVPNKESKFIRPFFATMIKSIKSQIYQPRHGHQ